jgi:hypothetical protein
MLEFESTENIVTIIPSIHSDFELPDNTAKIEAFKKGDFNADAKEDVLVYLGPCGTGGFMYALFLHQYDNYYKLAYFDYLKNVEFKIEDNGLWTMESSEELEPYNHAKVQKSIFKFDNSSYKYQLDTSFALLNN